MSTRAEEIIAQIAALVAELPGAHRAAILAAASGTPAPKPVPTAPTARFDACVAVVLANEGGYVNNPADPGGATNMGITHGTLAGWRNADVTPDDVRRLTVDEAKDIYFREFWTRNGCDKMAPGVDLAVFEFAVGSGGAIRAIQKKLGLTPDGKVGPLTLAKLAEFEPRDLVNRICDLRLAYMRALAVWPTFGNGWTRRVESVRAKALAMAGG